MKNFIYRVQDGQDLCEISQLLGVPSGLIIKLNGLEKDVVYGDLLYIEKPETVIRVGINESSRTISKKYGVDEKRLLEYNGTNYFYYGQLIAICE